jgi:hypothetical protein
VKKKRVIYYNCLPLVFYNLEPMKVHFLKENEERDSEKLLSKYLNLVKLDVEINEIMPQHSHYLNDDKSVRILCAKLDNTQTESKITGLKSYLNYLNESLDELESIEAQPSPIMSSIINENNPNENELLVCVRTGCVRPQFNDKPEFMNLCEDCYRKKIEQDNKIKSKLPGRVERIQSNEISTRKTYDKKVYFCKNEECENPVKISTNPSNNTNLDEYCPSCQDTIKKTARSYHNDKVTTKSTGISLPIHFETSDTKKSTKMTNNSKLYNTTTTTKVPSNRNIIPPANSKHYNEQLNQLNFNGATNEQMYSHKHPQQQTYISINQEYPGLELIRKPLKFDDHNNLWKNLTSPPDDLISQRTYTNNNNNTRYFKCNYCSKDFPLFNDNNSLNTNVCYECRQLRIDQRYAYRR